MTMADDYLDFVELISSDRWGTEIYAGKVEDSIAEEHLPVSNGRSSMSLVILNNKTYRWLSGNNTWVEM